LKYFGDAVILCGGESRRMPFDKSLIKLNGKYMIEIVYEKLTACFENVRLCADSGERFRAFEFKVIEDEIKGRVGPAVGIYSALSQATTKYVFLAACDMPLMNTGHIEFMKHELERSSFIYDALIPMNRGFIEPLYGFYSVDITKRFKEEITKGNYKIHDILDKCNASYLDEKYSKAFDENLAMFTNINSMSDLEKLMMNEKK